MKSKHEKIIDKIENIRKKNNTNWMDLLRVSFKTNPVKTAKIMSKIYSDDIKISKLVKKFASNAKNNNLDGIVCSPLELKAVRKIVGNKMLIVVPGIRLEKKQLNKKDDQKRILTPKEAIKFGADYLVIGRPIVESKNPLKVLKEINKSIKSK